MLHFCFVFTNDTVETTVQATLGSIQHIESFVSVHQTSAWDFADCSCVKNLTDLSSLTGTARGGRCSSNEGCKERQLYPFLFLFALVIFPMLSITAPAMQATLRSVPARLTSIAIGLQVRSQSLLRQRRKSFRSRNRIKDIHLISVGDVPITGCCSWPTHIWCCCGFSMSCQPNNIHRRR